ncbi:MAG: hypothetical protein K6G58_10095 [Lachnospiraceae bacterium]|nr:hypothetical protein [Lachnospiraceae bacterium]
MPKINKAEDKIIFVVVHPYASRDHHRFGAAYFMEQGYDVEIWRIITKKSVHMEWSAGMYDGSGYREYSSEQFRKLLPGLKDKAFFIFQGKPDPIFDVGSAGCRYMIMTGINAVPVPDPEDRSVLNIPASGGMEMRLQAIRKRGLVNYTLHCINDRLLVRRRREFDKKHPPMLTVTSTHYAARQYMSEDELAGNVLYTHTMDYDRFIEANRKDPDRTKKHILYCDGQMFRKGYDAKLLGLEGDAYHDADRYYSRLEVLFSKLEEHYGLPVAVAGSPHLTYEDDRLCGRKIYYNQTCELTKNAALFVVTTTTAMNFPALYDTPVLKIANESLKTSPLGKYANTYAYIKDEAEQIFGCGFLDLDDDGQMSHPWDFAKPMDPGKREAFIRDYIIDNDTADRTIAECMEEYLNGGCRRDTD